MRSASGLVVAVAVALVAALALSGAPAVPAAGATGPWAPVPGEHWQYQLQGTVRTTLCTVPFSGGSCVRPDVYDVDLYAADGVTTNAVAVAAIHAAGAHAVCYVDAGTWEDWRPDAGAFPQALLGSPNGWPGERWLDVRATATLLPIMDARVAACASAGFDAVEFDNVDGYTNTTGFPLTAADQLAYDTALAGIGHGHGLSVGLKNDVDQLGQLQASFDFAINEQCARFSECGAYAGFVAAGKAVVEVEYGLPPRRFCAAAAAGGRDAIRKARSLRATPWRTCR